MLEVANVLRQSARRGHDQRPGQFGRGNGGTHALCNSDAAFCAGRQVNVLANTASLRNQFQFGQLLNQGAIEDRAFTDQHDDVSILETYRQLGQALDGVGVDLGWIGLQFGCAVELAHRILVVIKNHNVHPPIVPCRQRHWQAG